ncbi:hypothetical protein MtrunA17_Chr2g0330501 [Medicago truncatula]|uniref:Phosphatase, putative n=1 Tax=Medicago truncatula TaxID=3880 RepID=A0A072VDL0_MEDTR|nr:phosphatase, putative [Medicago truncatula]RHN76296.1 hypothetical protein MtrunA17_Chr2g0330501 [Medicago truncatula]
MNFQLFDFVSKNSKDIKAHVHGWRDGEEFENVMLHIIKKPNIGKGNTVDPKIISVDCKLGTISIDANKSFIEAIPAPL